MGKEKGGRCASCGNKFLRHDRSRVDFLAGDVRFQRHLDCKELKIEVHPHAKLSGKYRPEEEAVPEV